MLETPPYLSRLRELRDCSAHRGGIVYADINAKLTLSAGALTSSSAADQGGAVGRPADVHSFSHELEELLHEGRDRRRGVERVASGRRLF